MPPVIWRNVDSALSLVKVAKSFAWLPCSLRRTRRIEVSWSSIAWKSAGRRGTVAMCRVSLPPSRTCGNCASKALIGITRKLSRLPPMKAPRFSNNPTTV